MSEKPAGCVEPASALALCDQRKGNRARESIDPGRGRGVSANHRVTNDHGLFLVENNPDAWWPDDLWLSLPFCG